MDVFISLSTLAAGISMAFSVSVEGILGAVISVVILKAGALLQCFTKADQMRPTKRQPRILQEGSYRK